MKGLIFTALLAAGLLFLVGCPTPVAADGCAVRSRVIYSSPSYSYGHGYNYYPTYEYKKEVATVIPVTVFQAVPLFVPTYSASYQPPPYTPPAASTTATVSSDNKAVLDALAAISKRLDALEGKGAPVTAPAPKPTPARAGGALRPGVRPPPFFGPKCGACHQRGKEADGGGFILLEPDGTLSSGLTDRDLRLVGTKISTGRMPPKKDKDGNALAPVTDAEASQANDFLDNLK